MMLRNHAMKVALAGVIAMTAANPALADRQARNALIGAGVAAAAGAVLSNGDPWVTVGSAAAGGVLGHVLTDDRRDRRHHRRSYREKKHHHKHHHRKVRDRWDDWDD